MGLAHDANAEEFFTHDEEKYFPTGEREVIVYIGLELNDAHTGPRLAIRTARDVGDAFYDVVHMGNPDRWTEGTVCEGSCAYRRINSDRWNTHNVVPRFTYLGPTWEGQR